MYLLMTAIRDRVANRLLAPVKRTGYLFSHLSRPDYQCRWKWELGDVAVWDNRQTQHYAVGDYNPHARTMHRLTVVDDAIGEAMR